MITVILPCYKSKDKVLDVLQRLDESVTEIIVVDDCCPQQTGKFVQESFVDERLTVIWHEENRGVGGAMKSGFKKALKGSGEIFVKLDSDGQMAPELMPNFIKPIAEGHADYCKGNRFYNLDSLKEMPTIRLLGNSFLSFFSKLSCGYWNVMDPTNGYIAVHRKVIENIPVDKLDDRYFFETSLLFRMNTINALVLDIPMDAFYADEVSNLSIRKSMPTFLGKNMTLFFKRIFYNYFLRDFNIASVNLILGLLTFFFGLVFGYTNFINYNQQNLQTPTGVQLITVFLLIVGFQWLLSFFSYDMQKTPSKAIYHLLPDRPLDKS